MDVYLQYEIIMMMNSINHVTENLFAEDINVDWITHQISWRPIKLTIQYDCSNITVKENILRKPAFPRNKNSSLKSGRPTIRTARGGLGTSQFFS